MKKIFLDFDGVLFDTVKEAYAVALVAHSLANNINEVSFLTQQYRRFRAMRCFVGPARDYFSLIPIVFNEELSLSSAKDSFFVKRSENTVEAKVFQEHFFKVRAEQRERYFENWLMLNFEYEVFAEISVLINRNPKSFCIVTTKDGATVSELISRFDVMLDVYDSKSFDKYGGKSKLIEFIMAEEGVSSAIFVDDSSSHLAGCRDVDNLQLIQPSWGYLRPDEVGVEPKFLIDQLESFLDSEKSGFVKSRSSMYGLERRQYIQLCKIRDLYDVRAITMAFDAGEYSFRQAAKLRRLTDRAGVGFMLYVDGVRDVRDSLELGVDGLAFSNCESVFGVERFLEAYGKVYGDHKLNLSVEITSVFGINNMEGIVKSCVGLVENLIISTNKIEQSLFLASKHQSNELEIDGIVRAVELASENGMNITIDAGSETLFSRLVLGEVDFVKFEKVILPKDKLSQGGKAMSDSLKFEELCILSSKEINDLNIGFGVNKLTRLEGIYD